MLFFSSKYALQIHFNICFPNSNSPYSHTLWSNWSKHSYFCWINCIEKNYKRKHHCFFWVYSMKREPVLFHTLSQVFQYTGLSKSENVILYRYSTLPICALDLITSSENTEWPRQQNTWQRLHTPRHVCITLLWWFLFFKEPFFHYGTARFIVCFVALISKLFLFSRFDLF